MIYHGSVTVCNREGVNKQPPVFSQIIQRINNGIKFFQFTIIIFQAVVPPNASLFSIVNVNGNFIT